MWVDLLCEAKVKIHYAWYRQQAAEMMRKKQETTASKSKISSLSDIFTVSDAEPNVSNSAANLLSDLKLFEQLQNHKLPTPPSASPTSHRHGSAPSNQELKRLKLIAKHKAGPDQAFASSVTFQGNN